MCKEFFRLTSGKLMVMIVFILASLIPTSAANFPVIQFDVISQLQLILLAPWFLLNLPALSYLGIAIWLVYIYIITIIYVGAYRWIEAGLRSSFKQKGMAKPMPIKPVKRAKNKAKPRSGPTAKAKARKQ